MPLQGDIMIVIASQIILCSVVFAVFLIRFYALNYYISYYVFVFQKIIKCILSARARYYLRYSWIGYLQVNGPAAQ